MSNFESNPKNENIEANKDLYQRVLLTLKNYNYEVNQTEAFYIRNEIEKLNQENKKIINDYIETNIISPDLLTNRRYEIIYRLFWDLYKINIRDYMNFNKGEFQENALKDLFKYIKEKVHKDIELL